ncbi:MAG: hypothetical protein A2029_05780 [Chloroflexi bacterium RBG_19FT_COMBO_47_9]|nr:MAG: hypothetical protein A2Y53_06165 [Chloroflexi bacterium RBG_16_47_49]OGO59975.1 MAG: hypothetical protein A2029_05780 [Chloroflexi bacterium RBG_19FT_COMBO_47_9]
MIPDARKIIFLKMRLEMEKFFDGWIGLKVFREIWKYKDKKYLGVTTKTDAEGFLQDILWSS